jgi:hypothetical protein
MFLQSGIFCVVLMPIDSIMCIILIVSTLIVIMLIAVMMIVIPPPRATLMINKNHEWLIL